MIDHSRGNRFGILIVGDSLPPNEKTISKLKSVLDPKHSVYNSLIIPIKYYLNNYLNSKGYQLPLEKIDEDFFFYINAVDDSGTKANPDLTKLKLEVKRPEHKIILSLGNFAFWAVENVFDRVTKKDNGISELGCIFFERINNLEVNYPVNLPLLHNSANLKFEYAKEFIPANIREEYISYFHYVGIQLGKLFLNKAEYFINNVLYNFE